MPTKKAVVLDHLEISDQHRLSLLKRETAIQPQYLWALRGGWGSARVLESWPQPSTPLIGFSDVTSLLWGVPVKHGGFHIHGPTLASFEQEPSWSQKRLLACMRREPLPALSGQCLMPGQVAGPCWVGNLTVATHLLGTAYLPQLEGAILIFEDVHEPLYKIDRMLTQWQLSGQLARCAGLGFGRFYGQNKEEVATASYKKLLQQHLGALGKPVIVDLPVGHGSWGNAALPIAQMTQISCEPEMSTLEVLWA